MRENDAQFHHGNDTTDFLPRIMAHVLRSNSPIIQTDGPPLRTIGEVVSRVLRLQEEHLRRGLSPELLIRATSPIRGAMIMACADPDVARVTGLVNWMADCIAKHPLCMAFNNQEETRQQRAGRKAKYASASLPALDLRICWSANRVVINLGPSKWTLPYECLRELHGKLSDLLSIMVYTRASTSTFLPLRHRSW